MFAFTVTTEVITTAVSTIIDETTETEAATTLIEKTTEAETATTSIDETTEAETTTIEETTLEGTNDFVLSKILKRIIIKTWSTLYEI